MKAYVDSSVVLRVAFGEPKPLVEWADIEQFVSSAIVIIECFRAVDRLRFERRSPPEEIAERYATIRDELSTIDVIHVTEEIVRRASDPFPISLKTLDAIHLASAMLYRERTEPILTFATHDRTLGLAARAVGFTVIGL